MIAKLRHIWLVILLKMVGEGSGRTVNQSQWHKNWLVDILLRLGFIVTLAWLGISLVMGIAPEEGVVLTITTHQVPTPCPE